MNAPATSTAVVTVVTRSHMHRARCLMDSVQRHLPEADRLVVLADRDDDRRIGAQAFEVLSVESLPIPDVASFVHRYGAPELCFATKPWALAELFRRGYDRAIYLDADIVVYSTLRPMVDMLASAAIMLTPHLTETAAHNDEGDVFQSELCILQAGTFNSGFVGMSRGPEPERFLAWWQDKLLHHCIVDVERGLMGDQRWLDLVPGMFDGVRIVRHPGWNFARWNMARRPLSVERGQLRVGGEPLVFCHFSGLLSDATSPGQRHNPDTLSPMAPQVQSLIDDYAKALAQAGASRYAHLPFAFAPAPVPRGLAVLRTLKSSLRKVLRAVTSTAFRRRIQLWLRTRTKERAS